MNKLPWNKMAMYADDNVVNVQLLYSLSHVSSKTDAIIKVLFVEEQSFLLYWVQAAWSRKKQTIKADLKDNEASCADAT